MLLDRMVFEQKKIVRYRQDTEDTGDGDTGDGAKNCGRNR